MIVITSVPVSAGAGKSGLTFLSLGNGARATAMGEAQVGLAEGANAIYWNPAGLALTRSQELTVSHHAYLADSSEQYAGFAGPLHKGRWGGLGFSMTRFAVTDIESRDAANARTGTVKQEDVSLQMSYGFLIGGEESGLDRQGLALGVGVKRVSEDLAGVSKQAVAFDLGAQFRPGAWFAEHAGEWSRRICLGVSALNLGKGPTFDQEETPLPRTTRVGVGTTHFLWGDALNLAVDAVLPRDGRNHLTTGAEFWVRNTVALRLGFVGRQSMGNGLRAGAGFRFQNINLDYAWAGFGDAFGDTHRFSLSVRFGEGAVAVQNSLRADLLNYHLTQAQDALAQAQYHEAVIEANHVLEIDRKNAQALQVLFEAGEKMKPADSLPPPESEEENPDAQ